jgi:hypothetical protein
VLPRGLQKDDAGGIEMRRQLGIGLVIALGGCTLGQSADPGATQAAVSSCPPSPAPQLFQNALCLCQDFANVGTALIAHGTNGAPATIGVNGRSLIVGDDSVDGSWISYQGLSGTGALSTGGDVVTTGDVAGVGKLAVGGDLSIGGNLEDVGQLSVAGTLRVAGQRLTLGADSVHATGAYSAPAAPPCPCDGASFLDVAAKVAGARTANDNAKIGLPTSLAAVGKSDVTLPTGSFYFDHVETVGSAHFSINGVVALYLDGSIDAVGKEQFTLAAGATLDIYVAGAVHTVGSLTLGSDPSLVRLYVGGNDAAVLSVGAQDLSATIYAPTAQIAFVGDTTIHGALFGKNLAGVGKLSIDYSAPQAPSPAQCPPTGTPAPTPTPNPGTPAPGSNPGPIG